MYLRDKFKQNHSSALTSYMQCCPLRGWSFLECLHSLMNQGKCTFWICCTQSQLQWSCKSRETWTSALSTLMALVYSLMMQVTYKSGATSKTEHKKWSVHEMITLNEFDKEKSNVGNAFTLSIRWSLWNYTTTTELEKKCIKMLFFKFLIHTCIIIKKPYQQCKCIIYLFLQIIT